MKSFLLWVILSTAISVSTSASAANWYVDGAVSSSGDGKSWETALKTIQGGINAASHGDTVLVAQGTYLENVRFDGKNITLSSTDPLDPSVVASTIIDGNQAGSVVAFSGTESEACTLSGFTLRNGRADNGGGIFGGEAPYNKAAIQNNTVTQNWAQNRGGGLFCCDGTIQNNTITGNSAGQHGGGLCACDGTIQNNTIIGNSAEQYGGGLHSCDGRIQNNVIAANSAQGYSWFSSGGGLSLCDGTIQNNTITGNEAAAYGGGLHNCGGTIRNNRISGNSGGQHGGGLEWCDGLIENNTIAGNSAGGSGGGLYWCDGTIQNNAITGNLGADGGGLCGCGGVIQNNTIADNSATDRGGGLYGCDGTVRNCIIWRNTATISGSQIAESNAPSYSCVQGWAGGGVGNINRYPVFVDPVGPDGLPETWEDNDYGLQSGSPCVDVGVDFYWFTWPQRDLDGNCRLSGDHVDMGCYECGASPDHDGDLLSDVDELTVWTDPYQADTDEDGLRDGLELLRGSNALEPTARGVLNIPSQISTIQKSMCVSMTGDEIIVAPGTYSENLEFGGWDIVLRSSDPGDADVVRTTVIDGGGLERVVLFMGRESGACVLEGFTIRNGHSVRGAGINGNGTLATIRTNTITGNSAEGGGGLYNCDGTIQRNTITGNLGGGLYYCDGTIQNNTIARNSAPCGGGLLDCRGTIRNNTIAGNSATDRGGGLYDCDSLIRNCIIWGNTAPSDPQVSGSSVPSFSCIQDWSGGGEGNIVSEPWFLDLRAGDCRLRGSSPCIDAGYNDSSLPATDIAGMHRIMFGGKSLTVDMGAHEFHIWPPAINSEAAEVTLTWSSLAARTYTIYHSSDMLYWDVLAHDVPSAGETVTTWVDSLGPVLPPGVRIRYYKVIEEE